MVQWLWPFIYPSLSSCFYDTAPTRFQYDPFEIPNLFLKNEVVESWIWFVSLYYHLKQIFLIRPSIVHILVPPQMAPINFGDEVVNWGEQVSSICSILKGDEPIEIEWSLNGEKISPKTHSDITISQTTKKLSLLNIVSATAAHTGVYTCIAKNFAGYSNRSAILSVNGT